jgi:hypothetical protein
MTRAVNHILLGAIFVGLTAGVSQAQTTTKSSQTKTFTIVAVNGNDLVVKLPEGTKEMTVSPDFRFTVDGKEVAVSDLKPGMKGSATITTTTTVTPVTVTEVKNGRVAKVSGPTMIVQTPQGYKMFTQGDVDKRGVKIWRDGKPAEVSDFREGDTLSATIVTSKPPKVVTEKQVNATTIPGAAAGAGAGAGAAGSGAAAGAGAGTGSATAHKTLPKTASSWPLLGLVSLMFLAMGMLLTGTRRFVR